MQKCCPLSISPSRWELLASRPTLPPPNASAPLCHTFHLFHPVSSRRWFITTLWFSFAELSRCLLSACPCVYFFFLFPPFFVCSPQLAPRFDNAFQSGVANLEFMKNRHRDGIIIQMSARHKWLSDKCAGPVLHLNKFLFSFKPAALWSQAKEFSFIVQGPLYLCL